MVFAPQHLKAKSIRASLDGASGEAEEGVRLDMPSRGNSVANEELAERFDGQELLKHASTPMVPYATDALGEKVV